LAKNTHKNVKKIAKSTKPNYMTASEIDRLEEEVSNRGSYHNGGNNANTMGRQGGGNRQFLSPEMTD